MNTLNNYNRLWEYLLLINPSEEIGHSIGNIKTQVSLKFGCTQAAHSPAHISLLRFLLVKGYEKNLLDCLFSFFINSLPFEVLLRNLDLFPRHTLYIHVADDDRLRKLQKQLMFFLFSSASVREENMKPCKSYYLPIARNLNAAQYESISREYRNSRMDILFTAKNIVLLKREYDEYNSRSSRWCGSHNFVLGY